MTQSETTAARTLYLLLSRDAFRQGLQVRLLMHKNLPTQHSTRSPHHQHIHFPASQQSTQCNKRPDASYHHVNRAPSHHVRPHHPSLRAFTTAQRFTARSLFAFASACQDLPVPLQTASPLSNSQREKHCADSSTILQAKQHEHDYFFDRITCPRCDDNPGVCECGDSYCVPCDLDGTAPTHDLERCPCGVICAAE